MIVFFFKQKTAYEMRISDWSSDVCSSDLGAFPVLASAGIVVASLYAGRTPQLRPMLRRVFSFPPFLALLLGIVVGRLGGWPEWLDRVFAPIGATLTPRSEARRGGKECVSTCRSRW